MPRDDGGGAAPETRRKSRIIIFTGKGGVGKTCCAAATAALCADAGWRTLVVSTDPAHSLGDAFSMDVGADPTAVDGTLSAAEVDVKQEVREHWSDLREYFAKLLRSTQCDEFTANELAYFPGIEEFLTLIKIQEYSKLYDVVVVDCAPTAGTLRILTFPSVWGNFFSKLFSLNRNALVRRVGSPIIKAMTNVPLPSETTANGFEKLFNRTKGIAGLLTDPTRTTVRLVLNPEKMVVRESYRNFTSLNLYEYHTDAIIANRLLPPASGGDFFAAWRKTQARYLEDVAHSFYPVPLLTAHLKSHSVRNLADIRELGLEIYGTRDPSEVMFSEKPLSYAYDKAQREYLVRIRVPAAMRPTDFDVKQAGPDLVVTIAGFKRVIPLPRVFQRCAVAGADLSKESLIVRYAVAR